MKSYWYNSHHTLFVHNSIAGGNRLRKFFNRLRHYRPVANGWGFSSTGWENSSTGSYWLNKSSTGWGISSTGWTNVHQPVEDFFYQWIPVEKIYQPVEEIPQPVATGQKWLNRLLNRVCQAGRPVRDVIDRLKLINNIRNRLRKFLNRLMPIFTRLPLVKKPWTDWANSSTNLLYLSTGSHWSNHSSTGWDNFFIDQPLSTTKNMRNVLNRYE